MRSSPSADPAAETGWLTARPYAHRGLHGNGRPENSRGAFEAAIAAGFGIELDVQASRDGEAMVFHDYALERLTGAEGRVDSRTAAELRRLTLLGTDETIPTLDDALALIAGRAPLLIELKAPDRKVGALCEAVRAALRRYAGPAAVMSFNPGVGAWFAGAEPSRLRGLVVTEENRKGLRGRLERSFALLRARPHFLAYDIRDLPSRFAASARARGLPLLTWTVRNARQEEAAAAYADQIIHELPGQR